jgi:membrane fusion protein, multidrug efflux system
MSIQGTNKDLPAGLGARPGTGWWEDFKGWCGAHPRLSRVLFIGLGLGVLALIIWAIYPKPPVRQGFNNGPQPVGVATAVDGPINVTLNALGTVTPLATASVHPQVSGVLLKLDFTEGQTVKAGDLLAEIDPRPYQAALDQAKGQLAKDQGTLDGARRDLVRFQALLRVNAESQQVVDDEMATVATASGVVKADEANVETAEINLGYTHIVSPVSGLVGLHQTDVGNYVPAGTTSTIVVVTEIKPMSVLFTVPEDNIVPIVSRIQSGATLSADAYDRSQTTKIATGNLETMDNEVDPTTGQVKLRALFDNSDSKLFPNQFVNIRLLVNTLQNQTVIPVAAVQRGADGSFVFLVTPDKRVTQRDVKLGVQDGDNVAIASGLQPGDMVVVDGADRLREGAQITIPNPGQQRLSQANADAINAARAKARALAAAVVAKACTADIQKFCAGQGARGAQRCLAQNRSSLSSGCATAMAAARGAGGGRGGRGGAGGAPP